MYILRPAKTTHIPVRRQHGKAAGCQKNLGSRQWAGAVQSGADKAVKKERPGNRQPCGETKTVPAAIGQGGLAIQLDEADGSSRTPAPGRLAQVGLIAAISLNGLSPQPVAMLRHMVQRRERPFPCLDVPVEQLPKKQDRFEIRSRRSNQLSG